MSNLLTATVICLVAFPTYAKPSEELTLKSSYSRNYLVDGARQVCLKVTLDEKGRGDGKLVLDPNIVDGWGSTCIAPREYSVSIRLVESKEEAAKGRRLYEIRVKDNEGREGNRSHWFLIRPLKESSPSFLVFMDRDGNFKDVLAMQ
jgi:hypothetical protein